VDVAGAFWSYTTFANNQGQQWFSDSRADYGWCYNFMAAAHVAGVVALLRAYHPSWAPTSIVQALKQTASNHASPNQQIGYGIPNANAALNYVLPPLPVTIQGPTTWPAYSPVTVQAFAGGRPPFTYAWQVNGSPYCGNQNWCSKTMGARGTSVYFYVTVTDADGYQGSDYHVVTAG
jgi:subtilisin family serine protease